MLIYWGVLETERPNLFFLMVSNIYEWSVIIVEPIVESLEHWRQAKSSPKIGNQNKGDDSMKKEKWVVFYHEDRELCAYTAFGTFPGEVDATKEMLAYENDIPQNAIRVVVERR